MLPLSCYWFSSRQFIVWLSLSLSLFLSHTHTFSRFFFASSHLVCLILFHTTMCYVYNVAWNYPIIPLFLFVRLFLFFLSLPALVRCRPISTRRINSGGWPRWYKTVSTCATWIFGANCMATFFPWADRPSSEAWMKGSSEISPRSWARYWVLYCIYQVCQFCIKRIIVAELHTPISELVLWRRPPRYFVV